EEEARRREYIDLIRSEISLYSAHTNIDLAENGMNDWLAEAIDLKKPYKIMDISCENPEGQGKSFGLGRVGELKEEISIEELIEKIKKAYQIDNVRSSNNEWTYRVKKVAIVGGSGEKYYQQALEHEVDVYITGDISYHGAQDMMRDGLAFIDPGHYIEHVFVEKMTSMLKQWNKEENWGIEIISAKKQKDVFRFK
ncbi:MAG: Nif3-like dinuclear metal center hexameric protein, partial [Atopostipes suicloacalis]|nr:Nif3-like dinuclear metal center hexameric protein [Atopostipes suicloacalis]